MFKENSKERKCKRSTSEINNFLRARALASLVTVLPTRERLVFINAYHTLSDLPYQLHLIQFFSSHTHIHYIYTFIRNIEIIAHLLIQKQRNSHTLFLIIFRRATAISHAVETRVGNIMHPASPSQHACAHCQCPVTELMHA